MKEYKFAAGKKSEARLSLREIPIQMQASISRVNRLFLGRMQKHIDNRAMDSKDAPGCLTVLGTPAMKASSFQNQFMRRCQQLHGNRYVQRVMAMARTEEKRSEFRNAAIPIQASATRKILNSVPTAVVQKEAAPMEEGSPQPQSGTVSGQPAAQQASAGCTPTPLSRGDFLRQSGNRQDSFGLTTLDTSQVTYPQVRVRRVSGRLQLEQTTAALPAISSIYTGAGTFTEGESNVEGRGEQCPAGRYPLRWTIYPGGARKIAQGEQEHCGDFLYAFDISLRRYANAVNDLADRGVRFGSRNQIDRRLERDVGVNPSRWASVFRCLAGKTLIRDDSNWHSPRPITRIEPLPRNNCRFSQAIISEGSFPHIGARHPSNTIITGCGEQ